VGQQGFSGQDIVEATEPGEETNIKFDKEITDSLTRGGVLSERPGSSEGLLPGSIRGVNLSEQGFRSAAGDVSDFADTFEDNDPVTVNNSVIPEKARQGFATTGVELGATVVQSPALADTGVEVLTNALGQLMEEGPVDVDKAVCKVGLITGQETVRSFRE